MRYASSASPSRPSPPVRHERTWLASWRAFRLPLGRHRRRARMQHRRQRNARNKMAGLYRPLRNHLDIALGAAGANAVERCRGGGIGRAHLDA